MSPSQKKVPEKPKTPRLVMGGIYESTDGSGVVQRRMVVAESVYPGDVHRYQVSDQARREIFFHSDEPMHEDFVRHNRLVGVVLSPELHAALVSLMSPAVDAQAPEQAPPEAAPPAAE